MDDVHGRSAVIRPGCSIFRLSMRGRSLYGSIRGRAQSNFSRMEGQGCVWAANDIAGSHPDVYPRDISRASTGSRLFLDKHPAAYSPFCTLLVLTPWPPSEVNRCDHGLCCILDRLLMMDHRGPPSSDMSRLLLPDRTGPWRGPGTVPLVRIPRVAGSREQRHPHRSRFVDEAHPPQTP
jgi:hypothetical protein